MINLQSVYKTVKNIKDVLSQSKEKSNLSYELQTLKSLYEIINESPKYKDYSILNEEIINLEKNVRKIHKLILGYNKKGDKISNMYKRHEQLTSALKIANEFGLDITNMIYPSTNKKIIQ